MALAPPRLPSAKPKNFQTLNRHPKSWTFIQFFDWTFSQCSVAWGEWVLTQFYGPDGCWPAVSEWMFIHGPRADHRSVSECYSNARHFCPNPRHFCRAVTYWFYWGFLDLLFFARHFLPLQFLCQNLPKNILPEILNDFNMLQIFYFGAGFGTGHAIHTGEHDENHPFTDGAAGYQNKPSSGSMRQSLT